jgi:hypothetical protein
MTRLDVNWHHFAGLCLSILVVGLFVQFGWRAIEDSNPPWWTGPLVGMLGAWIYPGNPFHLHKGSK